MSTSGTVAVERLGQHVMDSLLEGCQVIDFDHRYLYVNATVAAQARMTPEQLVGRTMMECFPGIERTPMFVVLGRCLTERRHEHMENEFEFPDGSKGHFELRFVPVPEGACILSLDVTEARRTAAALARTEEQFRHAQKMEAIGRLAGGVAHDFNNLLSVVLSYATILIEDMRPGDPARDDLEEIKRAGERAAELTKQLLVFSRRQILEPRILDPNALIADTEKMLRRVLGEDVELNVVASPGLGKIKCDPTQVEQVLLNLVVNARDAMPSGGTLTIETQNVDLDSEYAVEHWGVTPGPYVMIAVSDTGTGIDKLTRDRIFEPFFTTKERGKGTGLGLSTVYGIVQQSGGHVWVYSEPGKGSTFKVYFPSTQGADFRALTVPPTTNLDGWETVLLVDDEEALRVVARDVLRRRGYIVLEAGDGVEALAVAAQHATDIHLLLTDVVMPRMNGAELASSISATRPRTRILYMSGYTDDSIVHHGAFDRGVALLQKPITPESLLRRVREILDGASA